MNARGHVDYVGMRMVAEILRRPYARVIIPEEDGSGFSSRILEFPGCFSQGDTVQEAYDNLQRAAEGWLLSCIAAGRQVPEPMEKL